MDIAVFTEVVAPVLEMDFCSIAMITTPPKERNYFSYLFSLTDENGYDVFRKYTLIMICDRCLRKGRETSCTHKMALYLPKWKSIAKHCVVAQMLKNQVATFLRESYGLDYHEQGTQFPTKKIDMIFSRPKWSPAPPEYPSLIVVTCDPNAANSVRCSEMALLAMSLDHGIYTIIGMASHKCAHATEARQFLSDFIDAIRRNPATADAWIAFCPENNMKGEATLLAESIHRRNKIVPISEKGNMEEWGMRTSERTKSEWLWAAEREVSYERVRLLEGWINTNPLTSLSSSLERDRVENAFRAQLGRYADHELNAGGHKVSGCVEDGKIVSHLNDDLADAFCLSILTISKLWERRIPSFPYDLVEMGGGFIGNRKRKRYEY
jgi:hypothetical protein